MTQNANGFKAWQYFSRVLLEQEIYLMLRLRVNVLQNRLILNEIFVRLRYLVFFRITSMGIFLMLEAVLIPDYCFRKIWAPSFLNLYKNRISKWPLTVNRQLWTLSEASWWPHFSSIILPFWGWMEISLLSKNEEWSCISPLADVSLN